MQVANAVVLYIKGCHLRIVQRSGIIDHPLQIHLAQPCVKLWQLFEVVVSKVEGGERRQTSQLLHLREVFSRWLWVKSNLGQSVV